MKIRLSLAQINTSVGDLQGNAAKIIAYIGLARDAGADIIAFPEMTITGYPPEDLLLKPHFVRDNIQILSEIQKGTDGITAIIGFVEGNDRIFNAAAVLHDGELAAVYRKMILPNYGVFDEKRYFSEGNIPLLINRNGALIGLNICEDIWFPDGPARTQAQAGANLIININASPFHCGKWNIRERMVAERARENAVTIAYINMVGGQDELVFDGHSMVIDGHGKVLARGKSFEEELITLDIITENDTPRPLMADTEKNLMTSSSLPHLRSVILHDVLNKKISGNHSQRAIPEPPSALEEVYRALVIGIRDYVNKNGFKKVVIGLSGGIDSALVAILAVEALGKESVCACFLPTVYSSRESREDAEDVARKLGISLFNIPVQDIFESYLESLSSMFEGTETDTTEENLQARTRGNILMALSNKFGWLVLTTGNKSEMSVGYATLYGDMAGGFAVIKDVPKTMVYDLCRYINTLHKKDMISVRILTKAPTAELRPDQTDMDTLPPYETLDRIIELYIVEDKSYEEITSMGFSEKIVGKVIRMIDKSEYKRRQAPPGVKITKRALGKDWRMPITNRYTSY